MARKKSPISKFLTKSAKLAGHPITFIVAIFFVGSWLILGLFFGLNNTWLLILHTIATVNAALMVFIIQNTQNRESKALHLKIDELIRVTKEAERELIAIEHLEEEDLEKLRKRIFKK
jgi:low affinity Fe/Cu permease